MINNLVGEISAFQGFARISAFSTIILEKLNSQYFYAKIYVLRFFEESFAVLFLLWIS